MTSLQKLQTVKHLAIELNAELAAHLKKCWTSGDLSNVKEVMTSLQKLQTVKHLAIELNAEWEKPEFATPIEQAGYYLHNITRIIKHLKEVKEDVMSTLASDVEMFFSDNEPNEFPENHGEPWSYNEDCNIESEFHKSIDAIAKSHCRTKRAIYLRLKKHILGQI